MPSDIIPQEELDAVFEELEEYEKQEALSPSISPKTLKGSSISKAESYRIRDVAIEGGYKENEEMDIFMKELKLVARESSYDEAEWASEKTKISHEKLFFRSSNGYNFENFAKLGKLTKYIKSLTYIRNFIKI